MFFDSILEVFEGGVLGGLEGDDKREYVLCQTQIGIFGILRIGTHGWRMQWLQMDARAGLQGGSFTRFSSNRRGPVVY